MAMRYARISSVWRFLAAARRSWRAAWTARCGGSTCALGWRPPTTWVRVAILRPGSMHVAASPDLCRCFAPRRPAADLEGGSVGAETAR
jgi:hypothetical protein